MTSVHFSISNRCTRSMLYTLSLHDALPISTVAILPRLLEEARELQPDVVVFDSCATWGWAVSEVLGVPGICSVSTLVFEDRKSTRLNSSHLVISYAVFCLQEKTFNHTEKYN